MVKRLRDNLSSKYFEAGNRMTSRTARRRIVAYVERAVLKTAHAIFK